MKKSKVAIAIDKDLLDMIDSSIDGTNIVSRSQAISLFLKKGMPEFMVDKAVLLVSGKHQHIMFKSIHGKILIRAQIDFFKKNNIKNIMVVTQPSSMIEKIKKECYDKDAKAEVIISSTNGTAQVIKSIRKEIGNHNFIVMSGDTYNNFDLNAMIKKHVKSDKLATIGLMSREKPVEYGSVTLQDDLIVDFKEKLKTANSYVVNAGIYCFKPEVLELIDKDTLSLEKDLFPKLAKIKQLIGYFTFGEYIHCSE